MASNTSNSYRTVTHSVVSMDTTVTVRIFSAKPTAVVEERCNRALDWFRAVELICSRFDEQSEVMQLSRRIGIPVNASPLLFELLRFCVEIAEFSDGGFDPTVGYAGERAGFDRNYLTGQKIASVTEMAEHPSYEDVVLDAAQHTIMLRRPLILDLGGVAKGLAIDLAAQELADFSDYSIDAGGDLYVKGWNNQGKHWRIGIQHPQQAQACIGVVSVSDRAICTSGGYKRLSQTQKQMHHLIDPRTGISPQTVLSATVIAPTALLADALSTAAFVLDPDKGLALLQACDVEGVLVLPSLQLLTTPAFQSDLDMDISHDGI